MRHWLIDIRKEAHMSQQAVADKAGISQSYYAGIESGARGNPLGVPIAKAIAAALGFEWTKFYEDSAEPDDQE
ncbi:MAG: helix-turn-helix domain-containing protein [Oscillospiraceae bacterium]|nr:helix-turn-helix domain-containing protein [Oscillospiraceae bacterium]